MIEPQGGEIVLNHLRNFGLLRVKVTGMRIVRLGAIGVRLGAIGGVLFGGLFGVFEFLMHHDSSQIVSTAIYFAKCGIAAGGVLGICGGISCSADLAGRGRSKANRSAERLSI